MPQTKLTRVGSTYYAYSFTTGCAKVRSDRRMTEDDLLAYLLWLENHGRGAEAEELLEAYCSGKLNAPTPPS